jgi:hypothetical protein
VPGPSYEIKSSVSGLIKSWNGGSGLGINRSNWVTSASRAMSTRSWESTGARNVSGSGSPRLLDAAHQHLGGPLVLV